MLDLEASDLNGEPQSHCSSLASRELESVCDLMQKMVEMFAAKVKSQDVSICDSTPSLCPPTPGVAQYPPQQDLARSDNSSQSCDFCSSSSHLRQDCPIVAQYLLEGQIVQQSLGKLSLPDGHHLPSCLPGPSPFTLVVPPFSWSNLGCRFSNA